MLSPIYGLKSPVKQVRKKSQDKKRKKGREAERERERTEKRKEKIRLINVFLVWFSSTRRRHEVKRQVTSDG